MNALAPELKGFAISITQTENNKQYNIYLSVMFRSLEEAELYMEQNYPMHEWEHYVVVNKECNTFEELKVKWEELVEDYYRAHKHLKRRIRTTLH